MKLSSRLFICCQYGCLSHCLSNNHHVDISAVSALTDIGIAQNESYVSWTMGIFTDLHVQLFIDISADQKIRIARN